MSASTDAPRFGEVWAYTGSRYMMIVRTPDNGDWKCIYLGLPGHEREVGRLITDRVREGHAVVDVMVGLPGSPISIAGWERVE